MIRIDHVFITHAHIDHVVGLAFLLDSVLSKRSEPVTVHATPNVIATLQAHLFNWKLWPDFAAIPTAENAILRWSPMPFDSTLELQGRSLTSCEVNHTVEAAAYVVTNGERGFFFSGDMGSSPDVWKRLAAENRCDAVIVDCSFPDTEARIAGLSKHFCPQVLASEIAPMPYSTQFLITHLKPGEEENVMRELHAHDAKRLFKPLARGEIFSF
jgi:3',5'-cyclic-nucleotide phosphodiesterase